ncbi:MAG: LuxR C-terminal-related transcriptional regulator [Coriobacteriales bacterium]|jgi:DNA-binding CsgD family transcriptional regulator|nr:LuxR C-terminal-related transcriptional regulator [Coriobacteriales bacterium]
MNDLSTQNDLRSLFWRFVDTVRDYPLVSVSFGLYFMWTIILLQSPALYLGSAPFREEFVPVGSTILLSGAATYFVFAGARRLLNRLSCRRAFSVVHLLVLLLGVLCLVGWPVIPNDQTLSQLVMYVFGSCLVGVGTSAFCLEVGRVFRILGPKRVLCHGTLSLCGGSVLALLLTLLPPFGAVVVLLATPFAMVYCLRRSMQAFASKDLFVGEQKTPRYIPSGFLVVSLLHGLALGAMYALLLGAPDSSQLLTSLPAFIVATILLFLTALLNKMDFNQLIFRLGIPFMAAGFFFIAIAPNLFFLGGACLHLGYCYLYLIMCCLCSYLGRVHGLSSHWVIGLGTGCLLVGQLIGETLGDYLAADYTVPFATAVAFCLLLGALIMTGNNIAYGWGAIRPGADEYLSAAMNRACNELAGEFRLSKRETDVLTLLVRGRTRRFVSEQLNVSEETVKSHTGNIYSKLLIHSHSELMNLVEDRAAKASSGE